MQDAAIALGPQDLGARTCGVLQLDLPINDFHGQEVMLLIQTPVVEQEAAALQGGEPDTGQSTDPVSCVCSHVSAEGTVPLKESQGIN